MHLTLDAAGCWHRGARIVVSFAHVFEGAGQANSGAGGMIPDPIETLVADLPTNAFFAYGRYEGVPRVLDLMERHGAKLSSLIIGSAVETSPDLAPEIVRRSHEADAHGQGCENSFQATMIQNPPYTTTPPCLKGADGGHTIECRPNRLRATLQKLHYRRRRSHKTLKN
jgi:peptidoglycan/xylan/chitin deacetylase (PgdA/CDA1 family)